jgi:hypothetical protein
MKRAAATVRTNPQTWIKLPGYHHLDVGAAASRR